MRVWTTICFLAATLPVTGQEILVPVCPADHVLDQTRKVTAEERAAVGAEFDLAMETTGLGVYLVLLNNTLEEPPSDFAHRLADRWKGSADRAVLLSGPGLSPPLVIAMAGESLSSAPEAQIQGMANAALAAGQKAEAGLPALLEAARSLVAQVEVFRTGGKPGAETVEASGGAAGENNYLVAWIAGGSLACCLIALLVIRRGRKSALIFPQMEFRQRFSGPHSGGNDAVVYFRKQ